MAISPDLWKLVYAFGEAADDVGAVYADAIHSKKERDAATKRMVTARAALVAAIEAEVAEIAGTRDALSKRFAALSNAGQLAGNILYNLAGGATLDDRAKASCKEVQQMLDEARRP